MPNKKSIWPGNLLSDVGSTKKSSAELIYIFIIIITGKLDYVSLIYVLVNSK
jgi:hypothetical protein